LSQQGLGLRHPLVGRQAEVRVNDLNLGAVRLDRRLERGARLEADASRQRPSLHQTHWQHGEDSIAIELFLDLERRMEVDAHAERMGDGMGLINATGTMAPDIKFLERDHIGLVSGDHLGNATRVCSSVCANTSVDVVGHDAQRSWPYTLVPAVEWIHRLL
jgi:hypothetical protein